MVKNIFSILTARQTSILSAATIIMITVVLAKILGLIRDRLLAHTFSPDTVAIFFAAFRLPDFIFQLIILGALSIAFIPVFTEFMEKEGKTEAFKLAQSILSLSLLLFGTIAVFIFLFTDPLVHLIVPGFAPAQQAQVVTLTRVILLGQIILTVGSFFIGILQSFQRFIIPALAGVMYNLGIILGILFFAPSLGIMGAAVGVLIGASLHVLIQLPLAVGLGFRINKSFIFIHEGVKEIVKLMSMRTLGLAAEQINETVGVILASIISAASVTYLTFSQHLQVVPISLFGATLAQAALPILSSERARGRIEEFKLTLLTTMHQILFLSLPATAILIILRIPAVRLVFGASQYDWSSTVLTGKTLGFLAVGLAAQAVSLLLVRGFYALKDTRTPVLISFIVVATNIILSIYFVNFLRLQVWSLGLALSISNILSTILLFSFLHFKVGGFDLRLVLAPFGKMLMATVIMAGALYIPIKLLDAVIFDTTKTINLIFLTGFASIFALSVYLILVWMLKVGELVTFLSLLRNIFERMRKAGASVKTEEIIHGPESL